MRITITVTAKLESAGSGGAGSPVAEQTHHRLEPNPALWNAAATNLGQVALADVMRMVEPMIALAMPPATS